MTRSQLKLTLTTTKLLLQHQSASENRGVTYQNRSNLRNHEPRSCHRGGAARREVTRVRVHLALMAVRRLSLFPAFDHFRERRERSRHRDRNRSKAPLRQRSALSDIDHDRQVDAPVHGPWAAQGADHGPRQRGVGDAQTLTKGEQVLVEQGRGESVLALRRDYQDVMRGESNEKIAQLTGRNVIAVMSAHHLVSDLAAEIYVLDGPPVYREGSSPDGSRLPSERDLAEAFPANPMTGAQPRLDPGNLDDVVRVTTPDVADDGD